MEIPVYHKAIATNPLAAGLDATIYGTIKQGLSSPGRSSGLFMGRQIMHIFRSVAAHQSPPDFIRGLIPELSEEETFLLLREGMDIAKSLARPDRGGAASNWDCAIVYAVARAMNPDEIIETGTGVGATSVMALEGTRDNHSMVLTTFDREDEGSGEDGVPYYRWKELPLSGVGQLIPEYYGEKVVFVLGDIKETLPRWISGNATPVDPGHKRLVILDSLHTPEHQVFEVEQLSRILSSGSIILCDDTTYGWAESVGTYDNCGFLGGIVI